MAKEPKPSLRLLSGMAEASLIARCFTQPVYDNGLSTIHAIDDHLGNAITAMNGIGLVTPEMI